MLKSTTIDSFILRANGPFSLTRPETTFARRRDRTNAEPRETRRRWSAARRRGQAGSVRAEFRWHRRSFLSCRPCFIALSADVTGDCRARDFYRPPEKPIRLPKTVTARRSPRSRSRLGARQTGRRQVRPRADPISIYVCTRNLYARDARGKRVYRHDVSD